METGAERSRVLLFGLLAAAATVAAVPLATAVVGGVGGEGHAGHALQPAGDGLGWRPVLVGLHVAADILTGLAYVVISAGLIHLARRARHDLPYPWAFVAFGVFIVSCGLTHFMAVLTLWEPSYWLAGGVKLVTAVASVGTAAAIPALVPQALALVAAAKRSGEELRAEVAERTRDLEGLTVELAARNRALEAALADLRRAEADRTRLLESERAARAEAEEAVRARDRFLSVASHELRTPLTVVKGSVQLLRVQVARFADGTGGAPNPARLERTIERAEGEARRLERLLGDLLDVSRLRLDQLVLRRQRLDLVALTREATDRLRDRLDGRHALVLELPAEPLPVEGDSDRLDQVLCNVLENAAKYSPAGGTIRVGLERAEGGLRLEVRDEGIGLPPEAVDAVFEPFGRAANATASHLPGLGLGLHICRAILALHGGRISAESAGEGRGTTIRVWLPAAGEAIGGEPVEEAAGVESPRGGEPTVAPA